MERFGSALAERHFGSRCVDRLERRGISVKGLQDSLQRLSPQTRYLVTENGIERVWSATDIIAAPYATSRHKR